MTDPADRLYALNLLYRAGAAFEVREIGVIASIIPLIEADVVATIEKPIGEGVSATQAIVASRIACGCHRPNSEPPVTSQSTHPGQPAAAPEVHSGGGGLSGE